MARVLLVLVLLLAACDPATVPPDPPPAGGNGVTVTVDFVIDGDTFESTDGTRFRLDGINAPDAGECMFEEAREHLVDLIEGSVVEVIPAGTDQFGRELAQVHVSGVWVNLDLVSRGLALATTPGPEDGDRLVSAEDEAFSGGVGLWSDDACGSSGPLPAVRFDVGASVFDPPGRDEENLDAELMVVRNEGGTIVDLSGWMLRDESSRHRYSFENGTTLAPGESMAVTSADPGWDPGGSPVWNNSGDVALILDEFGRVVDRFRY